MVSGFCCLGGSAFVSFFSLPFDNHVSSPHDCEEPSRLERTAPIGICYAEGIRSRQDGGGGLRAPRSILTPLHGLPKLELIVRRRKQLVEHTQQRESTDANPLDLHRRHKGAESGYSCCRINFLGGKTLHCLYRGRPTRRLQAPETLVLIHRMGLAVGNTAMLVILQQWHPGERE